jgi:hypothetical protein
MNRAAKGECHFAASDAPPKSLAQELAFLQSLSPKQHVSFFDLISTAC